MTLLSDGRIAALIADGDDQSGTTRYSLVRFGANGALDETFGTAGLVPLPSHSTTVGLSGKLLQQSDGALLVPTQGQLRRYDAAGRLDEAFNGYLGDQPPSFGYITSAALQADGRIVVVGMLERMMATARLWP